MYVRWKGAGRPKLGGSLGREISRREMCVGVSALAGCWWAETWWLAFGEKSVNGTFVSVGVR